MPRAPGQQDRPKELRRALALKAGPMRIRGMSYPEIAKALNLPRDTARWYVLEYNRITGHDIIEFAGKEIAHQLLRQARERVKAHWKIYTEACEAATQCDPDTGLVVYNSKRESVKISALEAIQREDAQIITLCQSLGYIHEAPQHIVGQLSLVDLLQHTANESDTEFTARTTGIINRLPPN